MADWMNALNAQYNFESQKKPKVKKTSLDFKLTLVDGLEVGSSNVRALNMILKECKLSDEAIIYYGANKRTAYSILENENITKEQFVSIYDTITDWGTICKLGCSVLKHLWNFNVQKINKKDCVRLLKPIILKLRIDDDFYLNCLLDDCYKFNTLELEQVKAMGLTSKKSYILTAINYKRITSIKYEVIEKYLGPLMVKKYTDHFDEPEASKVRLYLVKLVKQGEKS